MTVEGAGCELRKRNGYNDWGLIDERGFGSAGNAALTVMEEYGGALFLGTANGGIFHQRQILSIHRRHGHRGPLLALGRLCRLRLRRQPPVEEEVTGGFGDPSNAIAFASTSVSVPGTDVLMMGVVGVSGTSMDDFYTRASLRAFNGTDWYHAAPDGFGSERNKAVSALYTRSGQVYAGTLNFEDGCEIWRGTPPDVPFPFITAIRASAGKPGTQVVIEGEYFDAAQGASQVVFADEVEAQVLSWSDTSITCLVPQDAVSGEVVVRTARGESNGSWFEVEGYVWYLAEGSTDGGMETWVLVQNPGTEQVTVDLTLMTENGPVSPPALQDVPVPASTRMTFPIHAYVTTYNVSTMVLAEGGPVICERAMYGGERTWAHDSIGVTVPGEKWYLAEGCTGGDFETFVLVQNPGLTPVAVDLTFMTSTGPKEGPQDYPIAPGSRTTFKANDYVTDWDVSTKVSASGREVICERAMYGNARAWAHDSIGVTAPGEKWYLAEGCTGGDFETWVLVQNPGTSAVTVDLTFMTGSGPVNGPQDYSIAAGSRHTFRVNDYVTDWDVSTMVTAGGGRVICERAMYGGNRTWGHDSVGVTTPGGTWYLAEGCTGGDFETWVLVQNPGTSAVTVDLTFMTGSGPVSGPQGYSIAAGSRHTFLVNDYVIDYDVSTMVKSSGGPVICERAMYGGNRTWAHDSIGLDP